MIIKILPFKNELQRKLIHLSSIFFPISYIYLDYEYFCFLIGSITLFLIIIDIARKKNQFIKKYYKKFLNSVTRTYENNKFLGASYMLFSFFLTTLFFSKEIAILSMLIGIISDSVAAIIGIKFGQIILYNKKTLEGTTFFIFTTIMILIFSDITLISIILCSLLLGLVELFSKTQYDNLTIPLYSAILLTILL